MHIASIAAYIYWNKVLDTMFKNLFVAWNHKLIG